MCGIVGIGSRLPIEHRDWLLAGRDAMIHRGPDDAGIWWSGDGRVGLGMRRLAIIDLSPAGHQPMQDGSGSCTIVFNGEIYNYHELQRELTARGHSFRSESDTEVILAAYREWGEDCTSHLNGMFAFAVHDAVRNVLFFARDRAGEKPLFYAHANGEVRFSSELKGMLADRVFPRRINHEALDSYLAIGYSPGNECIVNGVRKLPPAHAMVFDLASGEARVRRYWQLPAKPRVSDGSREDSALLGEFDGLLEDAVSRQLVADVPVGILLSGGVDSSLITAMAARVSTQVKTFTVGFPGFGNFDETEHARLIARHFRTEHLELNGGNIAPDIMQTLARQYDEPMLDSSMIPTYLLSHLVRQHCTVALGGDGGDELFGGYIHYGRLLWTRKRLGWLPSPLRSLVGSGAAAFLPLGFKGRNWLQSLNYDFDRGLPLTAQHFDGAARRQLMVRAVDNSWPAVAEASWGARVPADDDLLQRATRMEFENYLPEDILVKVDRASMLNSLEIRAPMLDYRIIEFAFGKVPSHLKATTTQRKILLKHLAARLLPPAFDQTRKQGFSIPLRTWLKGGPWRDYFLDVLMDHACTFEEKSISDLMRDQDRGMNNSERLFGLVLFELWRREYGMSI